MDCKYQDKVGIRLLSVDLGFGVDVNEQYYGTVPLSL